MSLITTDTGLVFGQGLQFQTAIGGSGLVVDANNSGAANLIINNGGVGMAIVFTDTFYLESTGFMGSAYIAD